MGSFIWNFTLDFLMNGIKWIVLFLAGMILYFFIIKKYVKPDLYVKKRKSRAIFIGVISSVTFFYLLIIVSKLLSSYFYFYYAMQCLANDNSSNAYILIKEAVRLYPTNNTFLEQAGWLAYISHDYKNAINYFKGVKKMSPEGQLYFAASMMQENNYKEAIKKIKDILPKTYNPDLAYYFLGRTYFKMKQYDEALHYFEHAEKYAVKYKNLIRWNMLLCYENLKNYEMALKVAKGILKEPFDTPSYVKKAYNYIQKHEKNIQ